MKMDIKDELQNIINNCENLLKEILPKAEVVSESGVQINFTSIKNMASKFNYVNEILSEVDEGSKYSYIKMMIYLFNKLEDKQLETVLLHIERILLGMKTDISVEDELINSYHYDEKMLMKYMNDITSLSDRASQMFAMDLLVILNSAGINDENTFRNISAVISKLGLDRKQVKDLFEISQLISKVDNEKFKSFILKDYSIDLISLHPYLNGKYSGLLTNNKNLVWINENFTAKKIYGLCKKNIVKENSLFSSNRDSEYEWYSKKGKNLVIENITLDFTNSIEFIFENITFRNCNIKFNSKNRYNAFKNCNNVVFENCKVFINKCESRNNDNHRYNIFENCKRVVFERCEVKFNTESNFKFENCIEIHLKSTVFIGKNQHKCFKTYECKKVCVENCTFENFSSHAQGDYASKYRAIQGCFGINNSEQVEIKNCSFKNCNTKHHVHGVANGAVGTLYDTKNIHISNCKFSNCKNYSWKYSGGWDEINSLFEVSKGVTPKMDNNKFDNCAKIFESNNSL